MHLTVKSPLLKGAFQRLKYVLSYVKQITSPGSMHEAVCSGQVHWYDPEGQSGEGSGRGLWDGGHMCTRGGFMSMYGKKHYNIVK